MNGEYIIMIRCHNYIQILIVYPVDIWGTFSYKNNSLSFWDSLIVASALAAGANVLYSEDIQDGLIVLKQLNIINPFK